MKLSISRTAVVKLDFSTRQNSLLSLCPGSEVQKCLLFNDLPSGSNIKSKRKYVTNREKMDTRRCFTGMTQGSFPWVSDWRHPWITCGARLKYPRACLILCYIIGLHSVLPDASLERWTSGHPASPVVSQHPQTTSVFITNPLSSCVSCHWRPKWDMYIGTPGRREGKLVGWLETSVLREHSQPFDRKNDWQWVFAQLADMGTQRWVKEPGWQKMCQNEDNKQGHANCVTIKSVKGQKGFWGDARVMWPKYCKMSCIPKHLHLEAEKCTTKCKC